MFKKIILFSLIIIFFSWFNLAFADIIISEIAWKGTLSGGTHEWLELANTGATTDISGWTIKDGENQLNLVLPSGAQISGGGFYVIKRSTSDITPYDFSAAFNGGLSDSGEKLILANTTGAVQETLDFSPLPGPGWPDPTMTAADTMQWNGSTWITAAPTPDAPNATVGITPPASTDSSSSGSDTNSDNSSSGLPVMLNNNSSTTSVTATSFTPQKIKTEISAKNYVLAGIPILFSGAATGTAGEKLNYGKYFWNFGDGDSKTAQGSDNQPFSHTYFYSGQYDVTLDYYADAYSADPDATDKFIETIVPVKLAITAVGDAKDFFTQITNGAGYPADISGWYLSGANQSFIFPPDTVLDAGKSTIVSGRLTHFTVADKNALKLITPQGLVAFDYSASTAPTAAIVNTPSSTVAKTAKSGTAAKQKSATPAATEEVPVIATPVVPSAPTVVDTSFEMPADALASGATDNGADGYYPWIAIGLVLVGAGAVYFIRRRKTSKLKQIGDDFEILGE